MEILGMLIISLGGLAINYALINTKLYRGYKSQAIIYIIFYYLYDWYGLVMYQIYDWFVIVYFVLALICLIYEKAKHTKIDIFSFNKYFGIALAVVSLILIVGGSSFFVTSMIYGIIWALFSYYRPVSKFLSKHETIKNKLVKITKNKFYIYGFVGVLFICLYIMYNPFANHIYRCVDEYGNKDYVIVDRGIANYEVKYVRAETKSSAEDMLDNPVEFGDAYEEDKSDDHRQSTLIYHTLQHKLDAGPYNEDYDPDFSDAKVHNHRFVKQLGTTWTLVE